MKNKLHVGMTHMARFYNQSVTQQPFQISQYPGLNQNMMSYPNGIPGYNQALMRQTSQQQQQMAQLPVCNVCKIQYQVKACPHHTYM